MTFPGVSDQFRKEAVRGKGDSFFLILLFQTERGGICIDFSSLEVKGSHRKMTDRSHSDRAGAKEMNGLQKQCLVSRAPAGAVLCHKNNSTDWLCLLGQSPSLSLSLLVDKVETFFSEVRFFLMGLSL